jgi:hypothetical protein
MFAKPLCASDDNALKTIVSRPGMSPLPSTTPCVLLGMQALAKLATTMKDIVREMDEIHLHGTLTT